MSNLDLTITEIMHGDTEVLKIMKGNKQKWPYMPYDAQVEYLQSDGTAYIDTGIKTTSDIRVESNLTITNASVQSWIYGGRIAAGNSSNALLFQNNITYKAWSWRYGGQEVYINHNETTGDYTISNKTTARTMVVSGPVSGQVSANAATFTTNYNIYIFSLNNGGNIGSVGQYCRIKTFKMYDGSTLVRDFVPVRKNGVGYLYDKVSGTLYGNAASTGVFTYGHDV